jgi:hypothetical protein
MHGRDASLGADTRAWAAAAACLKVSKTAALAVSLSTKTQHIGLPWKDSALSLISMIHRLR